MIEKKHNLQAPGSGLPTFENLFIKTVLVPLGRLFLGWKSARVWLNHELKSIEKMIKGLSEEELSQRVLIDHILGIEDDTRDWSVALVIEHLAIVSTGIIQVIKALSEEKSFDGPISIVAVKPENRTVTMNELKQIIKDFETFVPQNKNSKMTKAHPWFVEFNNKDWNTFLAIHTWVHKRQIKAILRGR
jgi:hypothetical protein